MDGSFSAADGTANTERSNLRITFVCAGNPLDVKTWSGTPFNMLKHLNDEFNVENVIIEPWAWWFMPLRRSIRRLTKDKVDLYWSTYWGRLGSRAVVKKILALNTDLVVCVAVSPICAQIVDRCRTIYITDATTALMVSYNPRHKALLKVFKENAFDMETRSITGSVATFLPSQWARSSAVSDHHGSASNVFEVQWGANLALPLEEPVADRTAETWNILFVGVMWLEKGGDIALACVEKIRAMGHAAHLDVVGSAPGGPPPQLDHVTFHGFLNKGTEQGRTRLEALYRKADILIFPTQFDALGIVTAEAALFGVPAISYRTGGVPANFIDGVTGILLEIGSGPDIFASEIAALLTDRARYDAMSRAAKEFSRSSLNWSAWAHRVAGHILAAVAAPVPAVSKISNSSGASRPAETPLPSPVLDPSVKLAGS